MATRTKRRTLRTSYVTLSVVLLLPLLCCLLKGPDKEIEAKIRPLALGSRGNILDRSGALLAYSTQKKDGAPGRIYPYDQLAREIIGNIDSTGHGTSGVELSMEEQLAEGLDVSLTIESEVQIKAEELLDLQMRRFKARFGFMAIMDTDSGEILALSSRRAVSQRSSKLSPAQYDDELFHASLLLLPIRWMKQWNGYEGHEGGNNGASKNKMSSSWTKAGPDRQIWSPWSEEFLSAEDAPSVYPKDLIALGFGDGQDKLPLYIKGALEPRFLATPLHILRGFNQLLTGRNDVSPILIKRDHKNRIKDTTALDKRGNNATTSLETLFSHFPVPALASVWWGQEKGQKRKRCEILALGFWPSRNPRLVFITAIKGAARDPLRQPGYLSKAKTVLSSAMEVPVGSVQMAFSKED